MAGRPSIPSFGNKSSDIGKAAQAAHFQANANIPVIEGRVEFARHGLFRQQGRRSIDDLRLTLQVERSCISAARTNSQLLSIGPPATARVLPRRSVRLRIDDAGETMIAPSAVEYG